MPFETRSPFRQDEAPDQPEEDTATSSGPLLTLPSPEARALTVRAKVANIDAPTFRKIADATKDGCPVSGALKGNVAIDLNASLES